MSNIGPINSRVVMQQTPQTLTASPISADQKASMNKVLSRFDSKNLTSADAKKITTEFKKLGVQPGRALEEVMAAAGFNAQQVGQLAFGSRPPADAGPDGSKAADAVRSSLDELKKSTLSANGPEGSRPPPPPPSASGDSQGSASISAFLKELLATLSTTSENQTSSTTADTNSNTVLESVSKLLTANGIDASETNLQNFMQILQRNFSANVDDKGNFFNYMA